MTTQSEQWLQAGRKLWATGQYPLAVRAFEQRPLPQEADPSTYFYGINVDSLEVRKEKIERNAFLVSRSSNK